MVNRVIIRSKVLQILFSAQQKENKDIKLAESELLFSLSKSYDLYHQFLLLIPHLTDIEQKRLDLRKHKHLATEEDKNPNTRFIDNRLADQLSRNEQLSSFLTEKGSIWMEEAPFAKKLLDQIIDSDIYKDYLNSADSYDADKEFWRQVFKKFICDNEEVEELLEDKSIYWNDDVDIIETFVLKTIKRFEEGNDKTQPLLPMFKDDEDRVFAVSLLRQTMINTTEYNQRINRHISKNWEFDRIANMDIYIMQMAIAEVLTFPSIPVNVTMNEYIDLAKVYSTANSAFFINGTLDSIFNELKEERILIKN